MTTEQGGNERAQSLRHLIALGFCLPTAMYLTASLMFVSPYSATFYISGWFRPTYGHGIYRYRWLGQELILKTGSLTHYLGIHLHTASADGISGHKAWDLFSAFVIVNGIAFVATALILYAATVRHREWIAAYLILISLLLASMYVIEPWDCLVHLFMVASVVVAAAARPWSWPVCLILAIAGTATHEQFLVVVALLAACLVVRPGGPRGEEGRWHLLPRRGDWFAASTAAVAVGSLGTYALLRVIMASPHELQTFSASGPIWFAWAENQNMSSAIAGMIVVLGLVSLILELPRFSSTDPNRRRTYLWGTALLWLFSGPYLAVSVLEGVWFEGVRLMLPVIICQYLLRWLTSRGVLDASDIGGADVREFDSEVGDVVPMPSSSSPSGSLTSGSRNPTI